MSLLASQAGAEVLLRVTPALRTSQAGVEVLNRVIPAIRVSQVGVEYLNRVRPTFAVSQAGVEYLHKAVPCSTAFAQIWTITRTDGLVLRFTSIDQDLEYRGLHYRACDSMVPSASENAAESGSVGNMELTGLLASGAVSIEDLHAGLFDGAKVEAWLIDREGDESPKPLLAGTFGQVSYGESGFTVELMGDGGRLAQTPLIQTIQPKCRWIFGDQFCQKDLAPLTVTGTIEDAVGQRGFTDSARTETLGYFSLGRVEFTSGNNAGIGAEIKEHEAGGVFTLWPRLAFPLLPGDEYTMVPGCTNLHESVDGTNGCEAWENVARYGGFKWVPGRDKVTKTADQKR